MIGYLVDQMLLSYADKKGTKEPAGGGADRSGFRFCPT